jgi:hypothetical protein
MTAIRLPSNSYRGPFGVKLQECESGSSPPSNVEVHNAWSYTSTPAYAFTARRPIGTEMFLARVTYVYGTCQLVQLLLTADS